MLILDVGGQEYWNEDTNEFEYTAGVTLKLEHSLLSVSKWEEKWKVPFLSDKHPKTDEMWEDYIRCMTINSVPDDIYTRLSPSHIKQITEYINDSHTATWFKTNPLGAPVKKGKQKEEIPTAELIYYWMFSCQIPKDCEKWHINRLMTLIRIFSVKNTPPEKLSKKQMASRRSALNAARRNKYHSKG